MNRRFIFTFSHLLWLINTLFTSSESSSWICFESYRPEYSAQTLNQMDAIGVIRVNEACRTDIWCLLVTHHLPDPRVVTTATPIASGAVHLHKGRWYIYTSLMVRLPKVNCTYGRDYWKVLMCKVDGSIVQDLWYISYANLQPWQQPTSRFEFSVSLETVMISPAAGALVK